MDAPGAAELRAQLATCRVRAEYSVATASLELAVAPDAPDAPDAGPLFPVRAYVTDGDDPLGELLLWLSGGRLASVEYAWVTDEPPTGLPDAALITAERD